MAATGRRCGWAGPQGRCTWPGLALVYLLWTSVLAAQAQSINCKGGTVSIVAHADDDLLFQAPYIFGPLKADCLLTVFVTAGDAGNGMGYAGDREQGNEAAKAAYLGVSNTWTTSSITLGGHTVVLRTLSGETGIQNIYMRLPDGNVDGSGFSNTGYPSLINLYLGYVASLTAIDGTGTYTLSNLKSAISQVLSMASPANTITTDFLSDYGSGDHTDHLTVARIVAEITGTAAPGSSLIGFMGYPVSGFPATGNISDADYQAKEEMFFQYTPYDYLECQSYANCAQDGRPETSWLYRQYEVSAQTAQRYNTTTAPAYVAANDIALLGTASASSFATGQPPSGANDGVIGGYLADGTGNDADEWSSNMQGQGAWWRVDWDFPVAVQTIVLYDRPNLDDQITSGSVVLGDGEALSFGYLPNGGGGYAIPIGNVSTTSVYVRVGSVGYRTANVGLSEVAVIGRVLSNTTTPGDGSNSTTPGSGGSPGTSFAWSNDIALFASASASSSAPDQGPAKAIDAQLGGYTPDGGDYTQEWSSNGEGVGAWLQLSWPNSININTILAYDRPNVDDQITSAVITFTDGSTVNVGSLVQDGSATAISLPGQITTTTLRFTVTGVSSATRNVGLRELVVLGAYASSSNNDTGSGNSTTPAPPPVTSWSNDLALSATASASSFASGQPPSAAIDSVVGGYLPSGGDASKEWSSNGQGAGAWLQLDWPQSIQVSSVVLYDRVNTDDQILSGTLDLSDGSSFGVGQLDNSGAGLSVNLGNRTITRLRFTVNSVSSTTRNVGLAEIAVIGSSLTAPSDRTNSTGTPIGGGSGTNDTTPSGGTTGPLYNDIALQASATASSSGAGQGADKAIDGALGGYTDSGGNYEQEWASNGERQGAWLQLSWPSAVSITGISAADRPNPNDQILGATITFSEGETLNVGALANDGSLTNIAMSGNIAATSLRFTVNAVSGSTLNAGLSELVVYGSFVSNDTLQISTINATTAVNVTTVVGTATVNGTAFQTVDITGTMTSVAGANATAISLGNRTTLIASPTASNMTATSLNTTISMPTGIWSNNTTSMPTGTVNSTIVPSNATMANGTTTILATSTQNATNLSTTALAITSGTITSSTLPTNTRSGGNSSSLVASSNTTANISSPSNSTTTSIASTNTPASTNLSTASRVLASQTLVNSSTTSMGSTSSSATSPPSTSSPLVFSTTSSASTNASTSTSSTTITLPASHSSSPLSSSTSPSSSSSSSSSTSASSSSSSSTSSSSWSSSSTSTSTSTSSSSRTTTTTSTTTRTSSTASSTSSSSTTSSGPAPTVNIAQLGRATASSSGNGTQASAAIDGSLSSAWLAGSAGRTGSWIQVSLDETYRVKSVRLYDLQGTSSGILGGRLFFSDGSSVSVGAVSQSGTTVRLTGSGKVTSSIRFTVTSARRPYNIGLAEIQAYNGSPP